MNSIANLTPEKLRRAADVQERILSLQQQLNELLGGSVTQSAGAPSQEHPQQGKRRRLSPQGLANIRAGVRKRMAAMAGAQNRYAPLRSAAASGRTSAAANRKRAEAMRARWAAARAAGRQSL